MSLSGSDRVKSVNWASEVISTTDMVDEHNSHADREVMAGHVRAVILVHGCRPELSAEGTKWRRMPLAIFLLVPFSFWCHFWLAVSFRFWCDSFSFATSRSISHRLTKSRNNARVGACVSIKLFRTSRDKWRGRYDGAANLQKPQG